MFDDAVDMAAAGLVVCGADGFHRYNSIFDFRRCGGLWVGLCGADDRSAELDSGCGLLFADVVLKKYRG